MFAFIDPFLMAILRSICSTHKPDYKKLYKAIKNLLIIALISLKIKEGRSTINLELKEWYYNLIFYTLLWWTAFIFAFISFMKLTLSHFFNDPYGGISYPRLGQNNTPLFIIAVVCMIFFAKYSCSLLYGAKFHIGQTVLNRVLMPYKYFLLGPLQAKKLISHK